MYRAAIEGLLGLSRRGDAFAVDPSIPARWPGFSIEWRFGETLYRIHAANPEHRSRGVQSATLDGEPVDPAAIPLLDDGLTHEVEVVLGEPQPSQNVPASPVGARPASPS
jgi:cellobiose phosphorylase